MSSKAETPIDFEGYDERDKMLEALEEIIEECRHKAVDGRIYDAENERVKVQYVKGMVRAISEYRQLLSDKELSEMDKRLEQLEE